MKFVESDIPPPKYMFLAWEDYYPLGGLSDVIEQFTDLDVAIAYVRNFVDFPPNGEPFDNYLLVETSTRRYVDWEEYRNDTVSEC